MNRNLRTFYRSIFATVLFFGGCSSDMDGSLPHVPEEQVALYDAQKEAIAYVDFPDDATIYLFAGTPVAFIRYDDLVFDFAGRFLGWFHDGVLYDKSCRAVGAKHGIVRGGINTAVTAPEKVKGAKQPKPELPPVEDVFPRPVLFDTWSEQTLLQFFGRQGD